MDRKYFIGSGVILAAGIGAIVSNYLLKESLVKKNEVQTALISADDFSKLEDRVKTLEDRLRLPDVVIDSIDLRQEFSVYADNLGVLSRENVAINRKLDELEQ